MKHKNYTLITLPKTEFSIFKERDLQVCIKCMKDVAADASVP